MACSHLAPSAHWLRPRISSSGGCTTLGGSATGSVATFFFLQQQQQTAPISVVIQPGGYRTMRSVLATPPHGTPPARHHGPRHHVGRCQRKAECFITVGQKANWGAQPNLVDPLGPRSWPKGLWFCTRYRASTRGPIKRYQQPKPEANPARK